MDARSGGAWRITMRSPDGVNYPLKGVHREVVRAERFVMIMDLSEHPESWHDLVDPGRDKSRGRPSLDVICAVTFTEETARRESRSSVPSRPPRSATR